MWKCSKCKRTFAVKATDHACVSVPLEKHFEGKPVALRKAFDKLVKTVNTFGEISVQPINGMICLKKAGSFATVVLRKDHFKLEFSLGTLHDEFPVEKTYRYSQKKIVHIVSVSSAAEVDRQLIGWLKESYSLAK